MKILVNALSARKGGIVTYTKNLISALEARGIDAVVAVPPDFDAPGSISTQNVDVGDFSPLRRFLWEQTAWRRIVKQHNPDVLFSSANFGLLNSPVQQVLLLREGGLFDPFYLANMTAEQGVSPAINRVFRRRLMLLSARGADQIITPTVAMRDMLANWEPSIVDKCNVNPYGTLNEAFTPRDNARPWRDDGVLRLLYVSVYYPHKLPGVICRAVDLLNQRGIPTHATITMSLEEIDQTLGSAHDQIVVREAADRGIVSLGNHSYSTLPELYRSHDVFVFPSVSETFGHPMAEAMSSGLPVVAANTPVNREICGDSALYAEPFIVSDLVDKILAFDADPAMRARLTTTGRARTLERYGWEDHVDRLVAIFERMTVGRA